MAVTDTHVIGDYTAAISIDGSTHFLLIQPGNAATAYRKINRSVFLGVSGQPMDTTTAQSVTNKTFDNTNVLTLRDDRFTLQDDGDATKQARFQLSGITTGQTKTYTLPDANTTLVGTGVTQTLTGKTLTSPVITGGSITGTTITTDAVIGQSSSTSGTIYGLSIASGRVGTNGVVTASITDAAVTATKAANGFVVQMVGTSSSAVATGTTTIPVDDTIPQITEGTEFMTQAITPKSTTDILVIEAVLYICSSAAENIQAALFQDATANALAVNSLYQATANGGTIVTLKHSMAAGTVATTTFRIRAGTGGASTVTFNGSGGTRRFGAITKSSLTITEYKA